jgi:putative transposase
MDGASSFVGYRMPDELWEQLELFLPKYPESSKGGRPRADLRSVVDAIFYRLRTGCEWKAIPPEWLPAARLISIFRSGQRQVSSTCFGKRHWLTTMTWLD